MPRRLRAKSARPRPAALRHGLSFALLCLLAFPGCTFAHDWNALFVFGDSYSDSGAGYVDSNGPTAVVYLAASLGIPFTYAGDPLSSGKSLNFAVSGAQTGRGEGIRIRPAAAKCLESDPLLGRGLQNQVVDFAQRVGSGALRFNPEKTLFFIAGGLNDATLPTATSIDNLEGEIRQLYDLGGRYFMVALLPTKIPPFSAVGHRLNPALAKIPDELSVKLPYAHIKLSQWGNDFDQVLDSPAQYGLTNVLDRCAGRPLFGEDPTPCAAPDAYFYYHDGHPSTRVHKLVALQVEGEVKSLFP